jgi:insertion element IS1 protein InsB
VGDRSSETLKRLWGRLQAYKIGLFCTDKYAAYGEILPWQKLMQSKAHTHIIESFNANVRHYLARFRRRTRCYSKSLEMIKLSLLVLFENHLNLFIN